MFCFYRAIHHRVELVKVRGLSNKKRTDHDT